MDGVAGSSRREYPRLCGLNWRGVERADYVANPARVISSNGPTGALPATTLPAWPARQWGCSW
jgi:hypothetical protein